MKALLLTLLFVVPFANAVSLVDTGGSGRFTFGGAGSNVVFDGSPSVQLTLTSASDIVFTMEDCCIDGDDFALKLSGAPTPWTATEGVGTPVLFKGTYAATLGSGFYDFDAIQVAGISGGAGGQFPGGWSMSVSTSEVPLPAAAWMFLSALGALGVVKRRQA